MEQVSKKTKTFFYAMISFVACSLFMGLIYISFPQHQEVSLPPLATIGNIVKPEQITISSPFNQVSLATSGNSLNESVNGAFPLPPDVPMMPGYQGFGRHSNKIKELTLIGVLPPNVVVMSDGNKSYTLQQGESSSLGTLEEVTMDGAILNGKYYRLTGLKK